MKILLATALLLTPAPSPAASPCVALDATPAVADTPRELYEGGRTFADFLAAAERRRELWVANWARSAEIDADLVERARAVGGTWRLLAVSVDGCSDSVSTIPWLARLAERVEGLDLRIVDSDVGRPIMEAHRTPDGRAATPTVVLLDADWNEAGCFIERPKALREWLASAEAETSREAIYLAKMEWYEEDAGRATQTQIVEMLEAAAEGRAVCM